MLLWAIGAGALLGLGIFLLIGAWATGGAGIRRLHPDGMDRRCWADHPVPPW